MDFTVKNMLKDLDGKADEALSRFKAIRDKYFRKERLTLGLTDPDGYDFAKRIVNIVRDGGSKSEKSPVKPLEKTNEGIAIPTTVSFTSRTSNVNEVGENLYTGAFPIVQNIASFEILWNEIRQKNGAYDTGFFTKPSGAIGCYSYRDPSPMASVEYFGIVCDEISDFLDTEPDVLKYVIGVFGSIDTVTTPRNDGSIATKRYLAGKSYEDVVKSRKECLNATSDELKRINSILRSALSCSTFTVVGPRDELEKIKEINRILDI